MKERCGGREEASERKKRWHNKREKSDKSRWNRNIIEEEDEEGVKEELKTEDENRR